MSGDFSGEEFEFAAGSVFGTRAWGVTPDGVLKAVSLETPWQQGVNEAACLRLYAHRSPGVDCQCGFYAYYDGSPGQDPYDAPRIDGVIEAYGRVVLGDRGFRAEKARIRALVAPGGQWETWRKGKLDTEQYWERRAKVAGWLAVGHVLGAVVSALLTWWPGLALLVIAGLQVALFGAAQWNVRDIQLADAAYHEARGNAFAYYKYTGTNGRRFRAALRGSLASPTPGPDLLAKVKANYPNVAFFSTFEAMMAEFPVEPPGVVKEVA